MQTAPAITMNSDVTVEKTGRLMKKSANKRMPLRLRALVANCYCSILIGAPSARFCPPEATTWSPAFRSTQHGIVIARNLAQLHWPLTGYSLPILLLGHKGEELSADARDRYYGHGDAGMRAPGNPGAD